MAIAIAALVSQEPDLLRLFAAYHLTLGIDKIFLYFDYPLQTLKLANSLPNSVECIPCSPQFWLAQQTKRPELLTGRIIAIRKDAIARARLLGIDALAFIDSDEFLYSDAFFPDIITAHLKCFDAVCLLPCEAVHDTESLSGLPFSQRYFKVLPPLGSAHPVETLYPQLGVEISKDGFMGHRQGKSIISTDARIPGLDRNHRPTLANGQPPSIVDDAILLHFDGIDFRSWQNKWRKRLAGNGKKERLTPQRHRQIEQIEQAIAKGEEAERMLYESYFFLTHDRLAHGIALNAIRQPSRLGELMTKARTLAREFQVAGRL
ncbi:hypothetical protein SAMN05421644_1772 [Allochromatium warmingii]|uniref:Glycosyl transferase family 2 n=1 Tax=Allochromatium warmingii TaxID=61595 RepID=A0A1H3K566_ALLWA|nr:hypothetical protein [Allochromatium warmingii]SDY47340.1 hypothetical protein SAMN05421644_1772 [Allochromatium warmingii]